MLANGTRELLLPSPMDSCAKICICNSQFHVLQVSMEKTKSVYSKFDLFCMQLTFLQYCHLVTLVIFWGSAQKCFRLHCIMVSIFLMLLKQFAICFLHANMLHLHCIIISITLMLHKLFPGFYAHKCFVSTLSLVL